MKKAIGLLLFALPCLAQGKEHQRDTWYIGFGLGSGPGYLTLGDESKSYGEFMDDLGLDSGVRFGLNFQAGATLRSDLLVGLEVAALSEQVEDTINGHDVRVQLQHNQYLATATYFPMNEGLYVKAGAGMAAVVAVLESDTVDVDAAQYGFGGMAGLGYMFWLGDSFNLGLGSDFHLAKFSGDKDKGDPTSGWFNLTYASFAWY